MTDTPTNSPRRSLTTPRAAAVAGILFALLYGTSVTLIRLAIPTDATADSTVWLEANARSISLALNLTPFAGIFFLWFIGIIRDRLGDVEDRFFATIFLGSGLLFLALTFMGTALAGGLLSSYAAAPATIVAGGVFTYGREIIFQLINVYAIRMAGVFMMTLATIWLRSGVMHRGWAFLTYALALVLLVIISISLWVILIFPSWVLLVSVYLLLISRHGQAGRAGNVQGAA
jgi:hypothetical protein